MYANNEQKAAENLRKVKDDYASYISQKAKLNWLKCRDDNTKLFIGASKNRKNGNTIQNLTIGGTICTNQGKIQEAFLQYFKDILCGKLEN